jgi:hypothetical protein
MRAGLCAAFATGLVVFAFSATPAIAAGPSPGWAIDSVASPTNFPPSAGGSYEVEVRNPGSVTSDGSPVTIVDTLPQGLVAGSVELFSSAVFGPNGPGEPIDLAARAGCTTAAVVRCELPSEEGLSTVAPDGILRVIIKVSDPGASGPLTNKVTVSGGGAPEVKASGENQISSAPPSFGPASFNFFIDGSNGARDTQAGDHPYELTTTIDLNSVVSYSKTISQSGEITSVQDLKEVVVDLPLGFAGSTLAAPVCALSRLSSPALCPQETVVGHIRTEPAGLPTSVDSPIWNLVPERGYPAEFGYVDGQKDTHVFYVRVVPTPAGYVLQATNPDIPQVTLSHIVVTFYGDPALRDGTSNVQIPFFTDPTDCSGGELTATIWMDSWQHPGGFNTNGTPNLQSDANWVKMTSKSPPVTGCDLLQFTPELEAQPTTHQADTPSGLEFALKLPQTETVATHATAALKNAVVTLPAGMTVDPSSGNGLGACSEAQIGWVGKTPAEPGEPGNFSQSPPECPESSKIGSLELETPLIPNVLHGEMYLAAQNENPFHSTLAGYIVVNDPVTGVLLKIAGELKTNPTTGQVTGVFDENPQLPFSNLKLHFFGGPRAELATPPNCGPYTASSELAPWSLEGSELPATPFDSFTIGEGCVNGFAPHFTALSTNVQAGAYTNFVASFSRSDQDQELGGLTVNLPPGLLANVASVPLCGEAQANAGTCPESTRVGTVQAFAGPGPNPLFVGGKVYLTGPYNGGPYGLSVVTPAIAGPFNFGSVIVRQSLRIDPNDSHVTDVSDAFPTILDVTGANGQVDGIPIKLRRVDVSIDRPGFSFNPTNCNKLQVGGAITSNQGASSTLVTPFQVTDCEKLKFAPKFSVSTSGKTSRSKGASLTAKVTYPNGPQGTYANIARVKVELPKALPSRLTTLQKACLAKVFEANPAACPSASLIGHAVATTPILAVPLAGPVYFVSYGGEKFPNLIMVLQGNGVKIDLVGTTFISKAGITSTTFKTVPDAPVGSFEITLPEGRYSALAANGNLCTKKLVMPNEFVAQNGAAIHESTKIAVTGCKQAKHHRRGNAKTTHHRRANGKKFKR